MILFDFKRRSKSLRRFSRSSMIYFFLSSYLYYYVSPKPGPPFHSMGRPYRWGEWIEILRLIDLARWQLSNIYTLNACLNYILCDKFISLSQALALLYKKDMKNNNKNPSIHALNNFILNFTFYFKFLICVFFCFINLPQTNQSRENWKGLPNLLNNFLFCKQKIKHKQIDWIMEFRLEIDF